MDQKVQNLWSIFTDHLNEVECGHYMYGITCHAWHHDASNILDGRPVAALLKFQIDGKRENSASFYRSGWSYFWLTMVTYWSRSASNVYALIGQKLTGEFTLKIYAASGNLFTDSWSWQSFVSSCHVLTVFFHWMYKMKYSGFLDSSIIHGWFVYWVFCLRKRKRRLSKSLEIWFRMASYSLIHLACGKRVEKSHAILALLDGFQVFQELHLDWYAWVIILFDVCCIFFFFVLSLVISSVSCNFLKIFWRTQKYILASILLN